MLSLSFKSVGRRFGKAVFCSGLSCLSGASAFGCEVDSVGTMVGAVAGAGVGVVAGTGVGAVAGAGGGAVFGVRAGTVEVSDSMLTFSPSPPPRGMFSPVDLSFIGTNHFGFDSRMVGGNDDVVGGGVSLPGRLRNLK